MKLYLYESIYYTHQFKASSHFEVCIICWFLTHILTILTKELDEATARLLREFVDTARSNFGSWAAFWHEALDVRGDDRVLYPEFRDGCLMLGWTEADHLFQLLDTDRARYLSWSTSSWLAGAELEDQGNQAENPAEQGPGDALTGSLKFTKAQSRAMHQKLREHRHRVKCFEGRARGELPGSHPAAGTTIYSSGPPLNSQPGSLNRSSHKCSIN